MWNKLYRISALLSTCLRQFILLKTEQSCKLQKPILANQDAIWKTRLVHVDHITVEILCTKLQELWTKSVGAV